MKKFLIFTTVAVFLLAFGTATVHGEERAILVYDDGPIIEVPASELFTSIPSSDNEYEKLAQTVRMDAQVFLWDADPPFEEITEVYPGQEVFLVVGFNRLDSLEIPFDQLIGRTLISLHSLRGKLKHKNHFTTVIGSDDGSLTGLGVVYTVPVDTQPGSFFYFGRVFMTGAQCVENSDLRRYPVVLQ